MKKAIAAAAMATLVVIAGITGASSAAHAAVFFSPAGTAVMSSFVPLLSPLVPLFVLYARIIIIVHRRSYHMNVGTGNLFLTESESIREYS